MLSNTQLATEALGVLAAGLAIGAVLMSAYHTLDQRQRLPWWVDLGCGAAVVAFAAVFGWWLSPELGELGGRVCAGLCGIGALCGPSVVPVIGPELWARARRALRGGKP